MQIVRYLGPLSKLNSAKAQQIELDIYKHTVNLDTYVNLCVGDIDLNDYNNDGIRVRKLRVGSAMTDVRIVRANSSVAATTKEVSASTINNTSNRGNIASASSIINISNVNGGSKEGGGGNVKDRVKRGRENSVYSISTAYPAPGEMGEDSCEDIGYEEKDDSYVDVKIDRVIRREKRKERDREKGREKEKERVRVGGRGEIVNTENGDTCHGDTKRSRTSTETNDEMRCIHDVYNEDMRSTRSGVTDKNAVQDLSTPATVEMGGTSSTRKETFHEKNVDVEKNVHDINDLYELGDRIQKNECGSSSPKKESREKAIKNSVKKMTKWKLDTDLVNPCRTNMIRLLLGKYSTECSTIGNISNVKIDFDDSGKRVQVIEWALFSNALTLESYEDESTMLYRLRNLNGTDYREAHTNTISTRTVSGVTSNTTSNSTSNTALKTNSNTTSNTTSKSIPNSSSSTTSSSLKTIINTTNNTTSNTTSKVAGKVSTKIPSVPNITMKTKNISDSRKSSSSTPPKTSENCTSIISKRTEIVISPSLLSSFDDDEFLISLPASNDFIPPYDGPIVQLDLYSDEVVQV